MSKTKPKVSKSTSAVPQKPATKINVELTREEIHKGLDMVLDAGGILAKATGDVLAQALFSIKAQDEAKQRSLGRALEATLDNWTGQKSATEIKAKAPVQIRDAAFDSRQLLYSIENLISLAEENDDGLKQSGATGVLIIIERLNERLGIVCDYIN